MAARNATSAEMALATEQFRHKMAQLAATLAKIALTCLHEAATLKKALNKQCWAAAQEKVLVDEANKQR